MSAAATTYQEAMDAANAPYYASSSVTSPAEALGPSQAFASAGLHLPSARYSGQSQILGHTGLNGGGTHSVLSPADGQYSTVPGSHLATLYQAPHPQINSANALDFGATSAHTDLFSGTLGSAATDAQGSDYFEGFNTSSAPGDLHAQSAGTPLANGFQQGPAAAVYQLSSVSTAEIPPLSSATVHGGWPLAHDAIFGQALPLQAQPLTRATSSQQAVAFHSQHLPFGEGGDALSASLGNVGMAIANSSADRADTTTVQTTLDHLSRITNDISHTKQDALAQAKETAAAAVAAASEKYVSETGSQQATNAPIHASLLQLERRPEFAGKAVHNYFCYIHQQCPIIHKPTFLRQISDGSVNRFVWFAMRALTARTLLHSHTLPESEVLVEEEYFTARAQLAMSADLKIPGVAVVQGLALLSLYILGTPRWQEASMYWCKATRLAQMMEFHTIDAPSRAIATKLHLGVFESHQARAVRGEDPAMVPGGLSNGYAPMAQELTPLEAELRRRLWWILFTNERFCAIAERLPTVVDESRMFVHLPCSAQDWDNPEFTYRAPERLPRYRREGYMRVDLGEDMCENTLAQELRQRKDGNLYMMSEIEYGFSMSHLVAFLADMGALFRPRSPYGNEYTPTFAHMPWQNRMELLRGNVERIEALFDMVRQNILRLLAETPAWDADYGGISNPSDTAVDPVLDPAARVPGIEIPHLHHLVMLILYHVLNIHLYRMVFQIHYEFSSSLPTPDKRLTEDAELLAAFDQYVEELWHRAEGAARHVAKILRGDAPGVPSWVLGLTKPRPNGPQTGEDQGKAAAAPDNQSSAAARGEASHLPPSTAREPGKDRARGVFREKIRAHEERLREMVRSVLASFRRTLPYALLLAAKVHVDSIKHQDPSQRVSMARSYLDLADITMFLETHQALFTSADYISVVKGVIHQVHNGPPAQTHSGNAILSINAM
ncbi:hypothetical protein GGF46_001303 [Coemansia sp. RSA 552]|nr:hypothetical protein GGF46_001303 [Coemansia sp. RSA 552]